MATQSIDTPYESRHIMIVCPNCNKPEPVPVYKVKYDGRIFWVCRCCEKWFPRE